MAMQFWNETQFKKHTYWEKLVLAGLRISEHIYLATSVTHIAEHNAFTYFLSFWVS